MGLGFQVDVFNNTSHDLDLSVPRNQHMAVTLPTLPFTLPAKTWLSQKNPNGRIQPFFVATNAATGSMTVNFRVKPEGQLGFFILDFTDKKVADEAPGMPSMGSGTSNVSPAIMDQTNGQFIFPLFSVRAFINGKDKFMQAVVVLVETIQASPGINVPQYT